MQRKARFLAWRQFDGVEFDPVERAFDIYDAYLPLAKYEQQAGPGLAVRKYILARRGVIASDAVRKPGPKLSAPDIADIERLIARQEKKLLALR